MPRPESHADLDNYARMGHLVATIPGDNLTRYPSLGQHLLAAVAEADRLGLVRDDEGSIRIPLTADELDARLARAQDSWDYSAERYEKAASGDPDACPSYLRYSVDSWAKSEGRDPIDWDALDAVEVAS